MSLKHGDKIMIKLGNRNLETYIDEHGTQRITPVNKMHNWMHERGLINLNNLAVAYHSGAFTFKEYLEYYLSINYSVGGFAELSNFQHLTIKNPLWENQSEQ